MIQIKFKLNGENQEILADPTLRFLDVLRNQFNLTGPKEGCGEGECGACAVLMDNKIVNSCILPFGNVHGKEIITIEGYAKTKRYEVISKALMDEGGSQCGICTPGMIIAAESLLSENPNPTEKEIRIGISGNLCRCTGYNMIVKAIQEASKKGSGLW
ncbi:MAG: ferredoxin [Tenericutes bacterium HGW-Tenericutes-2]|jgi:carbon-monoxide dehydrogenase small subunit|nr:MAG: ferredoxin [Tenericutes bacterium HGW-Tenericutes-2]